MWSLEIVAERHDLAIQQERPCVYAGVYTFILWVSAPVYELGFNPEVIVLVCNIFFFKMTC